MYRDLSPIGKVTVIKTLALSKITHIVLVCPHAVENYLNQISKLCFEFLWNQKPDRMKRVDTYLCLDKGGLKMPDIKCFWNSMKATWLKRLMRSDSFWKDVLKMKLLSFGYNLEDIFFLGYDLS